jgi:hypothetical protein
MRPARSSGRFGFVLRGGWLTQPACFRSRKYPARQRKTRGNDRRQPGTETAGRQSFSRFAAGRKSAPGQPLEVETRVQNPVGTTAISHLRRALVTRATAPRFVISTLEPSIRRRFRASPRSRRETYDRPRPPRSVGGSDVPIGRQQHLSPLRPPLQSRRREPRRRSARRSSRRTTGRNT